MSAHPSSGMDDVVHQRVRLGILSVLAQSGDADFTYLRDVLGATDGNLGRHLTVLNEAGYVSINKTFEGRRPRTWVSITKEGRRALGREVRQLRQLIDGLDPGPARLADGLA